MSTTSQSLERGIAVLELLDREQRDMGVREIGRRLDLSPTIVLRLLRTLCDAGYVMQDPVSQRYGLGYRTLSLGASLLNQDNLVSVAMPTLQRLADDAELNAFLGVLTGQSLVYVLALQSRGPIAIKSAPGSTAALHATAMGKAILAAGSDDDALAALGPAPLAALTEHTITDHAHLLDDLAAVRARGYALSMEENLVGVVSAGACARDAAGRCVAGVSVAFAPKLQPRHVLAEVVRLTVAAAATISRSIGCPDHLLPALSPAEMKDPNAA